ncbi:MAG: tetratricopeptide repeat protein [Planctomycetaceae bacterium]|nr:tetratricopeptide repeat protein [Planctomycetales bacterium]MCB9920736.1 tetratricopeptide repeat protein [Planctomycetaceae bacterium]
MLRSPHTSVLVLLGFARETVWFVCVVVAVCSGGCKSLQKDTISDEVIMARQMSLRGFDSLEQGELEDAEAWFANAIETNPVDERAHVQYAELLWRRDLREDAIRHLEQSVKLSGGDPNLVVRLGEMYLAQGNAPRAWQQAERAIQSNRQLPCAWALRGDVRRYEGKLDEALAEYHRSLSFEGYCPHVQLALASIYREQNRPRRALSTLNALAEHYPPDEMPQDILLEQGLALKALGRHENAAALLAQATQRGEPTTELLFHLAEAQLLAGDTTNARLALVAALAQEPTHGPSNQLKGQIDEQQQRMTADIGRY